MYKIEIQLNQNKDYTKLTAHDDTNKDTTEFERATASILKNYIKKALDEFSEELKEDEDTLVIDNDELDNLLKDLMEDLNNLKETMKDKKKED